MDARGCGLHVIGAEALALGFGDLAEMEDALTRERVRRVELNEYGQGL